MVSFVRGGRAFGAGRLRGVVHDLLAGSICSILTITYCLTYAALIFSGPLAPWLSYGIAVTFLSAAVASAVVAWRSSLPFAIAGPDSSTSAVIAALVAAMAERLTATGQTELLAPVLIVMALATGMTGLLLSGLGLMRAGRAIRFVPYPVIGGFMAATGWLMVVGAVAVIAGNKLTLGNIGDFGAPAMLGKLAAGLVVAATLELLLSRSQSPFILPGVLLAAVAAAHLGFAAGGMSVAAAQGSGWLFEPQHAATLASPWHMQALAAFPWSSLPALSGELVAVMFVTVVSLLLNTTGVEMATRREADIDRELKALGLASLVTAALGGFVSCLSLSRTSLNFNLGARNRLPGLTVAAIAALMLLIGPGFLGYAPKFALGGALIFAGARLLRRWIVQSARQLHLSEYASLLAVTLIIVEWGFIAGVLIGVIIGCATFAVSCKPRERHQVLLRRLGISQPPRPQRGRARHPGAARTRTAGHGLAELSVLRLGQPALPARQGTAAPARRLPLPVVRFPPGHRHRLLGHPQLLADQAGGRRKRRAHRAGQSQGRLAARLAGHPACSRRT